MAVAKTSEMQLSRFRNWGFGFRVWCGHTLNMYCRFLLECASYPSRLPLKRYFDLTLVGKHHGYIPKMCEVLAFLDRFTNKISPVPFWRLCKVMLLGAVRAFVEVVVATKQQIDFRHFLPRG